MPFKILILDFFHALAYNGNAFIIFSNALASLVFNRPGVAGAVLQTALWLSD